jgi:hypothetical protein
MDAKFLISNIGDALTKRAFPTVTMWNRLEGRPRTFNFDRALKAEVRDALWMLARQWQMGEFAGDDAGSPVFAKIHIATTEIDKYRAAAGATEAFDRNTPLEAAVERRPIAFTFGDRKIALDLRIQMGRQWLKLIKPVGDYAAAFIAKYPIALPDPNSKEDAPVVAHQESWQNFAAVAGRLMDGADLYLHLKRDPNNRAYDEVPVDNADKPAIDAIAARFVKWFEKLYLQPAGKDQDAWLPSQLEYRFACSAPVDDGEKLLVAEEYYHGHLDWYNFDVDKAGQGLGEVPDEENGGEDPRGSDTQTFIPVPIVFDGMPNTRWWTFEDGRTNFGDVKPDTTDLAKLLLIEFGLIYANDWFLAPHALKAGSIANIRGLAVTNVFGERFWIAPAGSGADDDWQRWSMFSINVRGDSGEAADTSLLLLPTVPKIQEGEPAEDLMLVRDEVANMVWGIEKSITLPDGKIKPGREAAAETVSFFKRLLSEEEAEDEIEYKAGIRYLAMTGVPENWIPFIPVHVPGDNRRIQLQRAAMPRILEGDPEKPVKVRPRTMLLREGLDRKPGEAYFLNEEEVPRAGVRVTQSFQRARWRDGRVFVWLGVRKQTGRGGGSSGLAFDRILDVEPAK